MFHPLEGLWLESILYYSNSNPTKGTKTKRGYFEPIFEPSCLYLNKWTIGRRLEQIHRKHYLFACHANLFISTCLKCMYICYITLFVMKKWLCAYYFYRFIFIYVIVENWLYFYFCDLHDKNIWSKCLSWENVRCISPVTIVRYNTFHTLDNVLDGFTTVITKQLYRTWIIVKRTLFCSIRIVKNS